jgi:ornithine--oxo-acid transaminase
MVQDIREIGLLNGIGFTATHKLSLSVPFEASLNIHPAMFGQLAVMRLFRDYGIPTQIWSNIFMVLKAAPPRVIEERQAGESVRAMASGVDLMHTSASFWTEALGLTRRLVNI